jgi:hypothetical protein
LCAWKAWFAIADAFGAPPVCEMFRHYPDALERATELDAQYGSNSPLDEMPIYGVVFSFKDPFGLPPAALAAVYQVTVVTEFPRSEIVA